jgi:hypothetical protein
MASDYRDIALEHFAADERELLERLASVEDDRETYRCLAQETLHALAEETRRHAATREQLARERDQHRTLREQIMTKSWEAA